MLLSVYKIVLLAFTKIVLTINVNLVILDVKHVSQDLVIVLLVRMTEQLHTICKEILVKHLLVQMVYMEWIIFVRLATSCVVNVLVRVLRVVLSVNLATS